MPAASPAIPADPLASLLPAAVANARRAVSYYLSIPARAFGHSALVAVLGAAMAVTLCTAMVIIVISVMGGFLELMRHAAQRLTGQVTVTRMLILDTIEERINQVLDQKRELFEMILSQTGEPKNMGLTQDEIFGLFDLRTRKAA